MGHWGFCHEKKLMEFLRDPNLFLLDLGHHDAVCYDVTAKGFPPEAKLLAQLILDFKLTKL